MPTAIGQVTEGVLAYKIYNDDASKLFTSLHTLRNILAAYKKQVAKAVASIYWVKKEIIKTERQAVSYCNER